MKLGSIQSLINNDDSIIGVATNIEKVSALAIIRISGPIGPAAFENLISKSTLNISPRYQYFCKLLKGNEVLDEILFTYFKAPNSFTGENCFELSLHGNPLSVQRIVDFLIEELKLRLAAPGEFTLRALRNKKLDLAQVEGLDNFLHAQSVCALNSSLALLNGEIHRQYIELKDAYLKLKMAIDLNSDFAEDMGEDESAQMFDLALKNFSKIIKNLSNRVLTNPDVLKTPTVCLVGSVNAGKSTLFNSILGQNRSIVSDEKGTTRDYVSELVRNGDEYFKLIDTAGIRAASNKVEQEGIKRSLQILSDSFYKILVFNPLDGELSPEVLSTEFDLVVVTHADQIDKLDKAFSISLKAKKLILIDQLRGESFGPIEPSRDFGPIEPSKDSGPIEPGKNSGPIEPGKNSGPIEPGKNSGPIEPGKDSGPIEPANFYRDNLLNLKNFKPQGIELALELITSSINVASASDYIFVARQVESIKLIYRMASEINELSSQSLDIGLISQLINNLDTEISQLIGIYTPDEVLNNIFSNFCIGK